MNKIFLGLLIKKFGENEFEIFFYKLPYVVKLGSLEF